MAAKLTQFSNKYIYSVQNGVNTDVFIPVKEKQGIREKYDLPFDKCIYVVVGSILPRKNVSMILNTFMNDSIPNSLLLIVGEGAQLEEFKQKYSSPNIRFLGQQNNPLPYLQASDYFISASFSEGLPNTVLESISCGIPVILSNIEPHKEILCEGTIGCSFHPDSSEDLCRAINEISQYNYMEISQECRKISHSANAFYKVPDIEMQLNIC